jgi:transcriptional antiterminator RfaH
VIQTKPKQERRALEHLTNQGYECVLLQYQRERLRLGVRALHDEPLFPRYLFIRLDSVSTNWSPIRSTRGVVGLVCFGGIPTAMPEGVVEALMQRNAYKENLFSTGDRVMITTGPFAGLEGVFEQDDGVARVVVLLEFMRKQQRLSMPVGNICRAG